MAFFDGGHLILTMVFERKSFLTHIAFEVSSHAARNPGGKSDFRTTFGLLLGQAGFECGDNFMNSICRVVCVLIIVLDRRFGERHMASSLRAQSWNR